MKYSRNIIMESLRRMWLIKRQSASNVDVG
jgi:hypothetical protein